MRVRTHARRSIVVTGSALTVIAVLTVVVWVQARPRSAEEREAAAQTALSGVRVTATAREPRLAVADAIADFGIKDGVKLVHVRIATNMSVDLTVSTERPVLLAAPPRFCLVAPFAAPDDAGLEDRCWGVPTLSDAAASTFVRDANGRSRRPGTTSRRAPSSPVADEL